MTEKPKADLNQLPLNSIVKDFCEESSIHGLSQIIKTDHHQLGQTIFRRTVIKTSQLKIFCRSTFLDVSTQFYKRVCPSVSLAIRPCRTQFLFKEQILEQIVRNIQNTPSTSPTLQSQKSIRILSK